MPQHALRSNFREQGALPPNSRFCPSELWTWRIEGGRAVRSKERWEYCNGPNNLNYTTVLRFMHNVTSQFLDSLSVFCMRLDLCLFVFGSAWCSPHDRWHCCCCVPWHTHTYTRRPPTVRQRTTSSFLATGPISHVATFASLLPTTKGGQFPFSS